MQGIMDRISVRRIQYASPGNVDVNGRADIFDEMHISLAEFAKNFENLKMGYGNLYRFLAANQLLKADAERFDKSGPLADRINSLAGALAAALKLPDIETIYRLTDRNALSFAKIVLSYFRRLERYYLFFAEGRVQEG
ncbi:uridylate kinase [Bradyrhizobium sp. USDA 4354]